MRKLVFIIFLLFSAVYAQNPAEYGCFSIRNFAPSEYGASTQNWAIAQDDLGRMYFGNNSGILQFDGSFWQLFPVKNNSCVRSIEKTVNGNIVAGASSEIGLLSQKQGVFTYQSLTSMIDTSEAEFYDIWEVYSNTYGTYFISDKKIYHLKNNHIKCIYESPVSLFASKVGNTIFIMANEIYVLSDTSLIALPHSTLEYFRGNPVILPYNDEKILCANSYDFFTYNLAAINFSDPESFKKVKKSDVVESLKINFKDFFKYNRMYCAARIDDYRYAIGTMAGGIILFNKKGQIISNITKQQGLRSNTVLRLMADRQGNLWAALDNGISLIELRNPVTVFNEKNNLDGSAYSLIRFNNQIYVGTNVGLFTLQPIDKIEKSVHPTFSKVFNIDYSNWNFVQYKNILFSGTSRGLLKITENNAENIFRSEVIYCLESFSQYPDILFMGLSTGLVIYDIPSNKFYNFLDRQSEVRFITCDNNKSIFAGTIYNGIEKFDFIDGFDKPRIEKLDTSAGLPMMNENYPVFINNELLVGTTKGIYKGFYQTGKPSVIFKPDSSFGNHMLQKLVDIIYYDADDYRYIINGEKQLYIVRRYNNQTLVDSLTLKNVPPANNLYLEPDNTLWLCTSSGLFKAELTNRSFTQPVNLCFKKIEFGNDSVFYASNYSDSSMHIPAIPYKANSVRFTFSLISFEQIQSNKYSFYLEGFDSDWSEWRSQNFKEYTNLHNGKYCFHVKGIDFYGNVSPDTRFYFMVNPPWYRSVFAYFVYIIVFCVIIWIAIILYSKRLKVVNAKLEAIIKQRTQEIKEQNDNILKQNLEILKQKEEILIQSKELERTNRELEKLSLVASETDNAVMILDAAGNFEWVNNGFSKIYGYTFEQLLEKQLYHLTDINHHPIVSDSIRICKEQQRPVYFETFLETEIRNLWIQTTLTPIVSSEGDVVKIVAIDSDISQIKLAEEEISMQKEELLTQSEQLEEANIELERKNLYITDSISYAKRIQMAILPSHEIVQKYFNEYFIYFLPKDIVSGDFYWISEQSDYIFIAVSDCTGHGVPGAFMSLIGTTLLNNIVNERKIYTPSEILNHLNSEIIKSLNYETELEEYQEDGMDITLCRLDKSKKQVTIASANHQVFVIANNELKIIEGEYRSVGGIDSITTGVLFPDHHIHYQDDILIYMLTDGLPDQFGGPENKKFMLSQFKRFVIENNTLPLKKQYDILKSTFEKWIGYAKQIDDVLVMAFRFGG